MDGVSKGMTMTVLRRPGTQPGPDTVTVVGVLMSHDQDVLHDLPHGLRNARHTLTRPAVALEARLLHQTTDHRQITALPVVLDADGQWVRDGHSWQASGAYLVPDDSRMSTFLHDLSGYAYDPSVALHDRSEG